MRIILILSILLLIPFTVHAKDYGDYSGAIYLQNFDGDTIRFNLPGLHPIIGDDVRVRVNGIDTPEIRGKCKNEKYQAGQAKEFVKDILQDSERIDLKNMRRGKYFRVVADVIADGDNLAELLVEAGLAVRYDGGKKNKDWCE